MKRAFIPLALLCLLTGLFYPAAFLWAKPYIPYLLGLVMFGMGAMLDLDEFRDIRKKTGILVFGVLAHYAVMPLLALGIGKLLRLDDNQLAGLLLVGCCPAGTASNVMAYIAKGNVPLSVSMTLASTALSPIATPLIFFALAGKKIHVPFYGMMQSIFWIIVFPLADGLVLRRLLGKRIDAVSAVLPDFSLLVILLLIGTVTALNHKNILDFPVPLVMAVILHNACGLLVGYWASRFLKVGEQDCRTVSIETGMQNSALGASLAIRFLHPESALPSIIFSFWQNVAGSMLAKRWAERPAGATKQSRHHP